MSLYSIGYRTDKEVTAQKVRGFFCCRKQDWIPERWILEKKWNGGSNRYWGGKNVFDSAGYRRFCREQARFIVDYIENYQKVGYKIISIVGCDGSPTCGVNYTNFYKNGGGRPMEIDRELIPGKGLFIEEIEKEAKERNIALPDFYGVGLDIFSSDLDQILSDFRNYLSQKAD